jgi:3-oxoacyl-[acyl-carrier protein] reductase
MKIENSIFLVTGGSLGIGKAIAKLLIKKGGRVIITGRNHKRLEEAANRIGAFKICADVVNEDDVKKTYQILLEKFGTLHCLINNAGIGGKWQDIANIDLDDFKKVYSINVFGAALMAREAVKIFIKQNYGNIVNISSTAGTKGFACGTVYSSSKFALRGMTQCWQAELRKYNIRVLLINPSEVTTAFNNTDGIERPEEPYLLRPAEIAHSVVSALEMDDRGFIPELTIWATNPHK